MESHMPERLTLTQNAQFYREDVALTTEAIRNILDAASDNKAPGSVFRIDQMNQVLCTLSVLLVCLVKKSSAKIIKSTLIIKRLLNLG